MDENFRYQTSKFPELVGIQEAFLRYYASLCFFADKLIQDRTVAEDIVEDTYIKLWNKQPDFSLHKNIKAALYISVKNACLDHIKQRKYQRSQTQAFTYLLEQEQEDFILNEITRAEVVREVYAAMEKLPEECRKVMELYYRFGLDHKTIAVKLGVTVSTVKNQKGRGIKILRERLGNSILDVILILGKIPTL